MPDIKDLYRMLQLVRFDGLALFYAVSNSFRFKFYTHAGSYSRDLIYISHGKPCHASISVFRVRIRGSLSGRTFSLRPAFLIPNSSNTIGYVVSILYAFKNRHIPACDFCAAWDVSLPTLRSWLRLFKSGAALWLRILSSLKELSDSIRSASSGAPFLPLFIPYGSMPSFLPGTLFRPVFPDFYIPP